jgi:hypothetical protein
LPVHPALLAGHGDAGLDPGNAGPELDDAGLDLDDDAGFAEPEPKGPGPASA